MQLFDSHCHLDDSVFKRDFSAVLHRAKTAGIDRMLIAGIDEATSRKATLLAHAHPDILVAAVGVHPHDSRLCSEAVLDRLRILAQDPKVVAWGEIGLDFNRMRSPQKDQEHWFVRQLDAADAADLPLIFHERDSCGRLLELLENHPSPGRKAVVHCFGGTETDLVRYLDMGFYIGITGIVTIRQRGEALRRMIPSIPPDRILIETDAPYLTPSPQRNKFRRNEPAFVREVLLKVAELYDIPPETLAEQIWRNTCALFRI